MAEDAPIQLKLGPVECSCTLGQLPGVLQAMRAQLPELMQAEAGAAPPTVRALLDRADAQTFGDKAGVVAYWLEVFGGRSHWRSADIVDALERAGEATPANITDTLNQKERKGLFEVEDRRWRLTGQGRGWVKYQLLHEREDDDDVPRAAG